MLGNLSIAPQSIYAYIDTKTAIDIADQLGYSLSFTGYAFGAWLAEQCVFFCHKDFGRTHYKNNVRGVTLIAQVRWSI